MSDELKTQKNTMVFDEDTMLLIDSLFKKNKGEKQEPFEVFVKGLLSRIAYASDEELLRFFEFIVPEGLSSDNAKRLVKNIRKHREKEKKKLELFIEGFQGVSSQSRAKKQVKKKVEEEKAEEEASTQSEQTIGEQTPQESIVGETNSGLPKNRW